MTSNTEAGQQVETPAEVGQPGQLFEEDAKAVATPKSNQQVSPAGAPQSNGEAGTLMQIIEGLSQRPDIDLDRVERLFAMYQNAQAREQERAFNEAMAAAQSEIGTVVRNQQNTHTNSGYADLAAVHRAAKPVWTRHGFSVMTRTERSDIPDHVRIICDVRHREGHVVHYEDDWPTDGSGMRGSSNKTPIQARGSTISYARRYTELMAFDLATGDDNDGNGDTDPQTQGVETLSDEQVSKVQDMIDTYSIPLAMVLRTARVDDISQIKAARYKAVMNWLDQWAKDNRGGRK